MTTRLASLLVQDGLVSVKRMEEAFQRQVIYGGSLDTILLEMRVIDEARLCEYLERATGLHVVSPDEIFNVDEEALRVLPQELAESVGIAPLGMSDQTLRVLVTDPPDRAQLDEIGFNLGVPLEPRIAPECRLFQAWNLRYGLPMPARHASLAARLAVPGGDAPAARLRPVMSEPPVQLEPPARVELPGQAETAVERAASVTPPVDADPTVRTPAPEPERAPVAAAEAPRSRRASSGLDGGEPLAVEAARERIEQATERDAIFSALVRAAARFLEYAAVFTVHGLTATGRLAISAGKGRVDTIAELAIPLEGESVVAATYRSAAPYLGPPGPDVENDVLFSALERPRPATVLVVPIVLRGRVVALCCGDSGARPAPPAQAAELFTLGHEASRAFLRLIVRAKGYARSSGTMGQVQALELAPTARGEGAWAATADDAATARFIVRDRPLRAEAPTAEPTEPTGPPEPSELEVAPSPGAPAASPARDQLALPRVAQPFELQPLPDHEQAAIPELIGEEPAPARPSEPRLEVIADIPSGPIPLSPSVQVWLAHSASGTRPAPGLGLPQDADLLVSMIESAPHSQTAEAASSVLERMGGPALDALIRRFPGRLRCDRHALHGKLPKVAEHSEVLRVLIDFGRPAAERVLGLLVSPDVNVRFYATYIFSELVFVEVVPDLASRLYDPDYGVRLVAVDVLRHYLATRPMQEVLERLRGDLPGPDPQHQAYAAEALGELRDVASVPRLIELVSHRGPVIAESARRALLVITKQDFAKSERQWRAWWSKNRQRHRVEWMLDGLAHDAPEIRLSSVEELRSLAHEQFGYHFDLPKRERDEARRRWVAWWERSGRPAAG